MAEENKTVESMFTSLLENPILPLLKSRNIQVISDLNERSGEEPNVTLYATRHVCTFTDLDDVEALSACLVGTINKTLEGKKVLYANPQIEVGVLNGKIALSLNIWLWSY